MELSLTLPPFVPLSPASSVGPYFTPDISSSSVRRRSDGEKDSLCSSFSDMDEPSNAYSPTLSGAACEIIGVNKNDIDTEATPLIHLTAQDNKVHQYLLSEDDQLVIDILSSQFGLLSVPHARSVACCRYLKPSTKGRFKREKIHRCQHEGCGYHTNRVSNLKNHVRVHTGEKPFFCHLCSYASSNISNLRIHIKRHNKKNK